MVHTWLHSGRLAVLAIAVACAPLAAQQTTPPAQPATVAAPVADSADVASPEAVVVALYDVISGPASEERNWDRFRSLFLPTARLAFILPLQSGDQRLINVTVEEFIRAAGPNYRQGAGFWERGIGERVERYGNIAHVFTAYETRMAGPDAPVAMRGINSVQMIHSQSRWWIANLVFENERPDTPIPPRYIGPANP